MSRPNDYERLQAITWYAVDADEHVGAFEHGAMSGGISELAPQWNALEDYVYTDLPIISQYVLLRTYADSLRESFPRMKPESFAARVSSFSSLYEREYSVYSQKGIYFFKGSDPRYGALSPQYRLICRPTDPLSLSSLPERFRGLVSQYRIPVRFEEAALLDLQS